MQEQKEFLPGPFMGEMSGLRGIHSPDPAMLLAKIMYWKYA
jgi:hypothetical protein